MNHRQARPLYSVQGFPLFSYSRDSLVFPSNKEELLLRKDEEEKANGLTYPVKGVGPVPQMMVKFNSGLSQILSTVFLSKSM